MNSPALALTSALVALVAPACVGLESGIHYPDYSRSAVRAALITPEYEADPGIELQAIRVRDDVCAGVDTATQTQRLTHDDLSRFLAGQGAPGVEIKARGNLYWFDFPGANPDRGDTVRLRLAVLSDEVEAAGELHRALLEHGPGWWGLRRSNLSVLAPKADLAEAMAFALRYKLVCWGMFQMAGLDDVFVVPGPYMEL